MEAEPPESPTALRVKDVTKNSLTLSWDAPYDKEGITGYTVERRHVDDDDWERVTRLPGQVTSHHVRGLPDGESFYFRVSAENSAGSSKPTELKTPVELKGRKEKPSAILNAPEVIEIGPKYAELSWQPPESDGGSPLTGYFLERIDISGFSWLPVNKQPILDTHYRVENLYEELQYQFRVCAANKEGLGEPSPATDPFYCRESFKLEAPKFSKEIEDTSVLEGHEAKFTCEVTGLPRPEVTWYRNFREVFGGRHYKVTSDGNVHMMVVKGLEEGETSYIECHAKNRCGSATTRAKLDVLVPAKIIDLPDRYLDGLSICKGDTIMLRVQFRGKPNPEVTWSVDKETIEAGRGTDITTTPRHTSLMIYDSDRSDGGVYTVTVKNKHGSDTANIPIKIIDRPHPPSGKPAIISFNKFSVKLAWNEPEDDGGSPVTGYIIEKCDLQTGVWRRAMTSKHPQCTVECLEEHKEYKFRILSENFIGISQPGDESDTVVTRDQAPELDYDELFDSSFRGTNVNVDKMKGDVLGKYIICEELGRGAFGVVHRAIERATDKNWAAKFIRCRPQEKELVRHEIEIMNQLHHPKLMQLHEAFDQTGEMVMILELLSGGELFDRLVAQDYEFTEEDCIVYMRQICQGVRHMHQQNIIHLDLKPENVMCVTKDTRDIKLIDFGLAQKLEEGKSVKVLFGTAEFCAPEIISFEPVSFCSDMWSVGVVSYVLLSGYSPFAGDNDQETFTNINHSDYDYTDDVWDNISDDARDFINKLLVRDRSNRMTIDEALAHPWLNPRAEDSSPPKPLVKAGATEKKLTGTKLSTQHHKDYQQRKRHREDELDILPIGRLSRDSAIFRREGEQGVIAKNIIMELPPHAPVFCEPLTDVSGFEGSRIEMTCKISAKPAPRIKWFKDGEELQEGKKYHMTYSDYYASLFINDLDLEDAGKYRCKASNDLGEDTTTGKLSVEEILHRRKRKEELKSIRVKYPKHDYDMSLLDSNIPPSFTLPLIDQVKHVGENCEFTVTVTCRPEPEVTWFHNNEEVHESEAFEFVHSKGVYRLIIHGVETLDAGQWRCEAVNKYGHSWCSCDLKVIDKLPEGGEPPVFIRKLQDTTIVEGSSVHLECKVKGQPHPEIEWYKDRKLIRSGRHYAISKEGSTCILTIHEAFPEDTGKYMCRAVNTVSSATTEAQLRVQKAEGEESEFLFEHYVPDEARLVERTVHFKIETEPNFTATLKDKSATVGTHVKMLCSITGIPAPRVIMYHNDVDVTGDDHYMITNNHGLVSLEFYSVKHSDAGRYTCKAVNSEGEASCQARLQVLDVEEETPRSPDYVRPSFTTPIHDLTVTAGDEASFSCVAIGKPMPGFKWQKDMVDVADSRRIFMGADSDGAAELIIRSARVSDSGLYSCVAQSSAGRTKCSAYLRVLAKSKSRSPPGSPETEAAKKLEQRYERARMEIPGGRAPRFTEPLPKVVELDEGDKLRLECEVEGYPKPKVTWYKATRNLTYDYRHRVKFEQNMHILEVNDVTVIDSGEFIAKATNDLGETETRCIVRVNKRRTEKEREVTTEAAQRAAAPFFIKHLPHSIDVMEGMDVQLDCIVEGDVTMVKYKRTEAKVVTEHFQSGDFEGTYHDVPMASIPTMSMPGAEGGAGSRPRLNIPEHGSKRAPRFVEEMEDGTIVTGSIATMSVVIDANPPAEVSWYKDGKKIKNTDHYETYLEDGAHNLEIFDTLTSDSGLYRCVARNEMGSAECQCKLDVTVRGDAGEDSFSTPSYDEEESGAKDAGPRKFPPRFVVELEPEMIVAIGEDVKLVCIIDDALDKVHWEKDGKKMSGDSRTKIAQEADGTQQLELSKAVMLDDGVYSCVAMTTSGETVTTETKLHVTEEKMQPLAVGEETRPTFMSQLKDVYCKDGEEVTLECEVTGLPRPQMTWHKDKHEILDSQDFQISTIGNKCRLTIAEVFPEDEGRYICKAINSLGEATASCQLLVEGKPSAPDGVPFVKNISHNCLTLSWIAPKGFPAKSILAYQIEVYNVFERCWKVVTNSCQGTSYDVKNLAPDTEYRFRVRAENLYGRSRPGHVSPVVRTRDISECSQQTDKAFPKPQKIMRRHSHHIKVDGGVATLLKRTEESKFENHVGTIPLKRNSSLRGSVPVQRRSVSAVFPGSRRDSVNSLRESRRSLEESSVVTGDSSIATSTGDDESASGSLRLKRFSNMSTSTTTEEESCNQSTSASSMTSIPEEADVMDNYTIPEEDDFLSLNVDDSDWKLTGPWTLTDHNKGKEDNSHWNSSSMCTSNSQQWQSPNNDNQWKTKSQDEDPWNLGLDRWGSSGGDHSHSQDIMSAPYSDDTKIAWCSPPSTDRGQKSYHCQEDTPMWKGQNGYHNNKNLSSFRGIFTDDDIVIKNLSSDSNGNYSFDPKDRQCCVIEEDDEAMDLVSAV